MQWAHTRNTETAHSESVYRLKTQNWRDFRIQHLEIRHMSNLKTGVDLVIGCDEFELTRKQKAKEISEFSFQKSECFQS